MIDAGRGHIVNISSIGAKLATPGRAAYAATKAALESLTRSWALEFAPHGIHVNAISPGPMHGPKMIRNAGEEALKQVGTTVPLGRTVAPQEVARAVLLLTSPDLSYATGSVLSLTAAAPWSDPQSSTDPDGPSPARLPQLPARRDPEFGEDLARCHSTVRGLMNRWLAISELV